MKAEPAVLSPEETAFLVRRRVARLATADGGGKPHAIPVCFAFDGRLIHIALDEKPKDVPVTRLKRIRNITENPNVALITDRYSEDWDLLAFVMVRGRAGLVEPGTEEHAAAVRLLRGKYHQYEEMAIEENPVISISPERVASWGALDVPEHPEPLMNAIQGRRSVRRYLDREVPEEAIEKVLEAARWAPSPHGRQPWRFVVLTRDAPKRRLADAMGDEWRRQLAMDGQDAATIELRRRKSHERILRAPVIVVPCLYLADLDVYPDADRNAAEATMAIQSLGCAIQNMLLMAYSQGLDGGWMCAPLFCPEVVVAALDLDPALTPHALITLGYAAADPVRRERLPLEQLIVRFD